MNSCVAYKYDSCLDDNQKNLYKNFPTTHYLSKPNNVENVIAWCTFWRRNLHLFVRDYLKIPLFFYQMICIYLMGISQTTVLIASRNTAKSFIIAVYAVARCILYPRTLFRIGSSTQKQAKLIVTEKILGELCRWSVALKNEIESYSTNDKDIFIRFRNGSVITVFVMNENARGLRTNCLCREEFRLVKKEIDDSIAGPFQMPRKPQYILLPEYSQMSELIEEPIDIFITSSWYDTGSDKGSWIWSVFDKCVKNFLKGEAMVALAFDEAIVLKYNLKTKNQLLKEKLKVDRSTWLIEYLNLRLKDSVSSFFSYSLFSDIQNLKQVFYPKNNVKLDKKSKHNIQKQSNEIRVISCDFAFVAGRQNDNSIYSCIRAIPDTVVYDSNDTDIKMTNGYKRQINYIEHNQLGDTTKQAIRVRQLYEDFNADYIVLDVRNGGIQVLYSLQKVLYDEERGIEYEPLRCMNNDEYAKVCQHPQAKTCIYAINASTTLNSSIAQDFRKCLSDKKISMLVNYNIAKSEILDNIDDYTHACDYDLVDVQSEYEKPFFETQEAINECIELQYEKDANGVIKIHEKGSNRKDRYSSISYGNYFISQLELNLTGIDNDYGFCCFLN